MSRVLPDTARTALFPRVRCCSRVMRRNIESEILVLGRFSGVRFLVIAFLVCRHIVQEILGQ